MIAQSLAEMDLGARRYDVCIIGSGPAGMVIANALGQAGLSVLVLEAGDVGLRAESQAEYAGDFYGAPALLPLAVSRVRQLGGTSNHWGGWCRPLESFDFESKLDGIDSAWPISRSDLEPYLKRASEILELSPIGAEDALGTSLRRVDFAYSPPVKFGLKYGPQIRRSAQVDVALNSCLTGFDVAGGRVVHAHVQGPDRRKRLVSARRFVLCAGGIENSRLLLWANAISREPVVPEPAALGRYWMEHPHFTLGHILLDGPFNYRFDQKNTVYIAPTAQAVRREQIMNFGLRIHPAKDGQVRKLIADLACVAPALSEKVFRRFHKRLVCGLLLRGSWEQPPRAYNRIVLSDRTDSFGMARADLHWYLDDFDRRTPKVAADLLAAYLSANGIGRIRLDPWVWGQEDFPADDEIGGNHHMGGTRMSVDPRRGVVDAHCRVHGMGNLYVGGSSVFPSAGFANPTLTIVQLALRLAEHLRQGLRRDGEQQGQMQLIPARRA